MKDIKILLKKKKTRQNITVSAIKISQKMASKNYLSKEKDVMKCEKITERSLKKVSVYIQKSKNGVILELPRLWFLAKRVG